MTMRSIVDGSHIGVLMSARDLLLPFPLRVRLEHSLWLPFGMGLVSFQAGVTGLRFDTLGG